MYRELQEQVFNWLNNQYLKDNNYTFSVRQKANKGAELNYFIGTEKSKYFSTTFWYIPVAYPGSSSDLINLVFTITQNKKIEFHIQFNQTKSPHNDQNTYALEFIQNVKPFFKEIFPEGIYAPETNKMEFFAAYSGAKYNNFEELKIDLEAFLNKIFPIVSEQIDVTKEKHPSFIAHRFSYEEQEKMFKKMEERFEKYKIIEVLEADLEEENDIIVNPIPKNINSLNQILYGPPGTGKTYNTIDKAISIANPDFDLNKDRTIVKEEYNRLVEAGQIAFTTFHQSMTYEDFIEGIKPETKDDNVIYDLKDGVFKLISDKAKDNWISSQYKEGKTPFEDAFESLKNDWEEDRDLRFSMKTEGKEFKIIGFTNRSISFEKASGGTDHTLSINTLRELYYGTRENTIKGVGIYYPPIIDKLNTLSSISKTEAKIKNFVLIIDEINRGNVSQIFGELITLLEEDKRLGNDEALEVILPYSKEKFGVPSNLHIIGTMNTADRSVEALDTALRRRFVFEEMPPKYELDGLQQELYGHKAADILHRINLRIEKLLDRDHQIGHAYFLNKDENTIVTSFYKNIIPLLQEYFFGDYGKIGLVLGKGFVKLKENNSVFAKFDYADASQFEERETYQILDHKDNFQDFGNAIELLMS